MLLPLGLPVPFQICGNKSVNAIKCSGSGVCLLDFCHSRHRYRHRHHPNAESQQWSKRSDKSYLRWFCVHVICHSYVRNLIFIVNVINLSCSQIFYHSYFFGYGFSLANCYHFSCITVFWKTPATYSYLIYWCKFPIFFLSPSKMHAAEYICHDVKIEEFVLLLTWIQERAAGRNTKKKRIRVQHLKKKRKSILGVSNHNFFYSLSLLLLILFD